MTDETLARLSAFKKLEWVSLRGTKVTGSGLSTMCGTAFDDAAVKHLTGMANLQDLTLNYTKLGDKGFQQLLARPKLRSLYVDGTMVSKEVYQKAKKEHPKIRLFFYRYDQ